MNFTFKDLNNKDVKLSAFKGKVVLLDFWATWCGPCKIEIPWFVEFQEKYGKSGLEIIGISVDDTVAKAKPFAAEWKMNYTRPARASTATTWTTPTVRCLGIAGHHRDFPRRQDLQRSTSACRRKTSSRARSRPCCRSPIRSARTPRPRGMIQRC